MKNIDAFKLLFIIMCENWQSVFNEELYDIDGSVVECNYDNKSIIFDYKTEECLDFLKLKFEKAENRLSNLIKNIKKED